MKAGGLNSSSRKRGGGGEEGEVTDWAWIEINIDKLTYWLSSASLHIAQVTDIYPQTRTVSLPPERHQACNKHGSDANDQFAKDYC
jgi:hypothetical protein